MSDIRATRTRDPWRRRALLGAGAIAVIAVIGLIAYTANTGLPFQSSYDIAVDVPNADRLIDTADVRVGGVRVGEVLGVSAIPAAGNQPPYARVRVALSPSVGDVPVDTTAQVRPASVLGLTYLDLTLGTSPQRLRAGGTLPLSRALPSSDLTDLLTIFTSSSARRFQQTLGGLAAGVAGRGTDINTAIASTSHLLPEVTNVAQAVSAPQANLAGFLRAYEHLMSGLQPVGGQLAGLITGGAATFAALTRARTGLGSTIDAMPAAESAATQALTTVRPSLDRLARLVVELRPAGTVLPGSLTQINATLAAGTPALRAFPGFADKLRNALTSLDTLSRDPKTSDSLRKLTDLSSATRGALSLLVPAQVDCNVISLFTSGFAGVFGTLGTGDGPSLGALFLEDTGAIGEAVQNAHPSPNVGINPIPNENAQECEAGNEPWTGKQQLGNPAGLQSRTTRPTVPPPGVQALAQSVGLMTAPEGLK